MQDCMLTCLVPYHVQGQIMQGFYRTKLQRRRAYVTYTTILNGGATAEHEAKGVAKH